MLSWELPVNGSDTSGGLCRGVTKFTTRLLSFNRERGAGHELHRRWRLLRTAVVLATGNSKRLSEALRVTPRNVTGLVDSLEGDGLVARSAHPSDRRATLVTLTAKGKAVTAAMRRDQDRFAQDLFSGASSEELASLVSLLDRVMSRVRSALAPRG